MAADRAVKVEVDVEGMVALIREAGTGRFIEAMLDFCRKCVGADFVSILAYSRTGDPTLVGTATTSAAENARNAAIACMPGAYLTHKTSDEIASPQYRRACYGGRGSPTAFRSCAWGRRAPRPSVSITAAKMGAFPIANSTEPMRFCQLMASADFHGVGKAVNLALQKPAVEEMQAGLKSHPRMTLRELQVVAVKAGMSARQIAAELGIAETTVITHRSSTYARMGVANLGELLLAKNAFRRLVANRDPLRRLAPFRGWRVIQQRKCWAQKSLKQLSFRPNTRQHANTEQNAEQRLGEVFGRQRLGDGSVSLTIADASKEEPLDLIKKDGDDFEEFGIVRSALDGRVHQHAAAALLVGK
jgi:DNA-binding CsgD family transcriptional regulator